MSVEMQRIPVSTIFNQVVEALPHLHLVRGWQSKASRVPTSKNDDVLDLRVPPQLDELVHGVLYPVFLLLTLDALKRTPNWVLDGFSGLLLRPIRGQTHHVTT